MKFPQLALSIATLLISASSLMAQTGNPASVVRTRNCNVNDGYTFADVVTAARALPRDANSPNLVFMREAVLASPEYQENWDFQLASYYPSYEEMFERRAARNVSPLPPVGHVSPQSMTTCGPVFLVESTIVHFGEGNPGDATAMLTRLCDATNTTRRAAYNRIATIAANFAAEGNDMLVQVFAPAVGGSIGLTNSQFMIGVVGSTFAGIATRLDLLRTGFRPGAGLPPAGFSCNRWSGWNTHKVHAAAN